VSRTFFGVLSSWIDSLNFPAILVENIATSQAKLRFWAVGTVAGRERSISTHTLRANTMAHGCPQ